MLIKQVNGFLNSIDSDAHAQLQTEIKRLTKINSELHEELETLLKAQEEE